MNWIPTKERLPDKPGLKLVVINPGDDPFVTFKEYFRESDWGNVTHWMEFELP